MKQTKHQIDQWLQSGKSSWDITAQGIVEMRIPADMPYHEYFLAVQALIGKALAYERWLGSKQLQAEVSLAEVQDYHDAYYQELSLKLDALGNIPYDTCLANPDYTVRLYGEQMGRLLCMLYLHYRQYLLLLTRRNYMILDRFNKLYLIMQNHAHNNKADYHHWHDLVRLIVMDDLEQQQLFGLMMQYSAAYPYYRDIILSADLSDLRYLYKYAMYIPEHTLALARFMAEYPETELKQLAAYIVQAYKDGFERGGKDMSKKKALQFVLPAGMERLARLVIQALEQTGLAAANIFVQTNPLNRQYGYDHRFDSAIYYDKVFTDRLIAAYGNAVELLREEISLQAGPVYIELFGETPFAPKDKPTALKFSDKQMQLNRKVTAQCAQLIYQYYRREENSFCIIAFPSPEIGPRFPEYFAETVKINLLDSNRYALIQQHIIDALDKADHVRVLGKPGNATDITVQLHKLADPATQTNFENCVADVNIPVGEVFTSPLLKGTNGILHVEDIYLKGLRFYNLKLTFTDGYVTAYNCTNFEDAEASRRFVHENLLFPHETLPIGEFAIGTNTTAYKFARQNDLLALLPILIIEKMGPHFAIGDTCYSREEDKDHFNFTDGKKIIAVDNEKSATRKTDPLNAYTQAHCDITLPYEMLASITAIQADGTQVDIIRDGRFVLPGTEELNIPLAELEA